MPGPRSITRRRLQGKLCGLLVAGWVLAAVGGGAPATVSAGRHTEASGAAASSSSNLAQFPVDSPAMIHAELIATKFWNTSPCGGVISVSWSVLDPSINASSTWWNPVAAYGNAGANSQCKITFNQSQEFDWPMFCTVMVHEVGHLVGQQHSTDQASVMYPIYVAPIPECKGSPTGASAPPTAAAPAATTATTPTRSHRAHSRHKAHKKAKKRR